MSEPVKCFLRTLVPLHIGCDEVYEPIGFVVDEEQSKLVTFDPTQFLAQLPSHDLKRFSEYCQKGTVSSILELFKFLRNRRVMGRRIDLCHGVVDHYRRTVGLATGDEWKVRQELNQFQIFRTSFVPDSQRPYIPGSSLKGAIRTAYLNAAQQIKRLPKGVTKGDRRPHSALEQKLLEYSNIETDPFRMLKVSDFMPVGNVKTRVMYALNHSKESADRFSANIPQILEVIEPGGLFQGTIRVDVPERDAPIRKKLIFDEVWDAMNSFFKREKALEDERLAKIGIKGPDFSGSSDERIVRLGRHSGAECVTIEGHREIAIRRPKQHRTETMDHATTIWLAAEDRRPSDTSKIHPMGWAVVGKISEEKGEAFSEMENEWRIKRAEPLSTLTSATPNRSLHEAVYNSPGVRKPEPKGPIVELWEEATLTWTPGNSELSAKCEGKSAIGKGLDTVPEGIRGKLTKKKRLSPVRVQVEVLGDQYYRILVVEPLL